MHIEIVQSCRAVADNIFSRNTPLQTNTVGICVPAPGDTDLCLCLPVTHGVCYLFLITYQPLSLL